MSVDVRRGLKSNLDVGCAPAGTPPRGYLAERIQIGDHRDGTPRLATRWVPDPDKASRATQVFRMFADGHNYPEIHAATQLYKSPSCYASMLRNRSYLGIAKFGPDEYPNHHPALVDQDTWDKVQARIHNNHRFAPRTESGFLLAGLAYCDHCGQAMAGGTDHRPEKRGFKPWRYYRCYHRALDGKVSTCPATARTSATQLENRVVNAVLRDILTPQNVQALLADWQHQLASPDLDAEVTRLDQQIAGVRRAISNLLDLVEAGQVQSAEAATRLKSRQAELIGLETQRAALESRRQATTATITMRELEKILETMREKVQSEEIPAARRALRSFIDHVTVRDAQLSITYRPEALTGVIMVPPRGLELTSCTFGNYARKSATRRWLALAVAENGHVWRDRPTGMNRYAPRC